MLIGVFQCENIFAQYLLHIVVLGSTALRNILRAKFIMYSTIIVFNSIINVYAED